MQVFIYIGPMNIDRLLELNELAREEGKLYPKKRELYTRIISSRGKHFTGVVGPRGVGKTVLLKQIALELKNSFYISLDTLEEEDLFETAKLLAERYGIKILLLDEVHFQKEYDKKLKNIFDFLDVRITFTSSVSLSLFESSYDLARRAKLEHLYPFSFKEYLSFKKGADLPSLTLDRIVRKQWTNEHMLYEHLFNDYLKGELMPFSLEEPDVYPLLKNILDKIIRKDIPSVAKLRMDEIPEIERTLQFIGRSPAEGINFTSISKNIGITRYKAEQYVKLLEKTFVLNPVYPAGTNVLKEPKILMYLPFRLLYQDYTEAIGAIREDFFAEVMRMTGNKFYYLKTKRGKKTPDFLIKDKEGEMVVEIGGKGKGREQFKGINIKKSIILTHSTGTAGIKRPLFLLGFI